MPGRPDRYKNAIVAHLYVDGAAEGIAFYQRAFGALELLRLTGKDGRIVHAELDIAGQVVMMGDPDGQLYAEPRALGRTTVSLHIMVDDNAALVRRAVAAGAELIMAPTEMSYGASSASVRDPFGHVWVILTWREDRLGAGLKPVSGQ